MADGEVVNEFSKVFDMVKLSLSISPSSSSSSNSTQAVSKIEETIVEDEVDLSLGLSLGGRFGIDRPTWSQAPPDGPFSGPSATFTDCQSPWPPEVQAEWKKRKDLESQKKSEAKRRKSDKQKKSENEVIQAIKRVLPLQLACLEMHKGDGSLVSGLLHKCRKDEKRLKAKNNGHVLPWQLPLTSSVSS